MAPKRIKTAISLFVPNVDLYKNVSVQWNCKEGCVRIISACKGTQRGMNLPQPGTTKTKGRKEQTSSLKPSWEAERSAPPFHQLMSHTWVCMVRALLGTLLLFLLASHLKIWIISWLAKHLLHAIVLLLR